MEQNKLRQNMLNKRNALDKKSISDKSKLISNKLIKNLKDTDKNVLAYFPFENEVDIRKFLKFVIKKNGFVILPKVINKTDLHFFLCH